MKLPIFFGCACWLFNSCTEASSQTNSTRNGSDPSMDSTGAISWVIKPGNTYFYNDPGSKEFYIYIQLKGNDVMANMKRVPLNISLVLDRSGSMSGDKIAYARKAANFVIDQLGHEDLVSIVNYDDKIEVSSPSALVKNKEILRKKINELTDRGSTNLTGGMLEGYSQVKSTRKDGYVNRVLLLTDGLANAGITDPRQIKQLVEKRYNEEGVALSTFGLGADYNEDLLTALAEVGRANYYFIDSPDKIPAIFASELKGLLSVVAQNTLVSLDIPSSFECIKVYGHPFEVRDNKLSVRFNDMYSKDEKGVLIKFRARSAVPETVAFNSTLRYTDARSFNEITDSEKIIVNTTGDKDLALKNENALVQEMIALFESTEQFDDIMATVDAGDYEKAKVKAGNAIKVLQEKQKTVSSEKLKKQEETLTNYSKEIDKVKVMRTEDVKMYQKTNKSSNYKVKKGKN